MRFGTQSVYSPRCAPQCVTKLYLDCSHQRPVNGEEVITVPRAGDSPDAERGSVRSRRLHHSPSSSSRACRHIATLVLSLVSCLYLSLALGRVSGLACLPRNTGRACGCRKSRPGSVASARQRTDLLTCACSRSIAPTCGSEQSDQPLGNEQGREGRV